VFALLFDSFGDFAKHVPYPDIPAEKVLVSFLVLARRLSVQFPGFPWFPLILFCSFSLFLLFSPTFVPSPSVPLLYYLIILYTVTTSPLKLCSLFFLSCPLGLFFQHETSPMECGPPPSGFILVSLFTLFGYDTPPSTVTFIVVPCPIPIVTLQGGRSGLSCGYSHVSQPTLGDVTVSLLLPTGSSLFLLTDLSLPCSDVPVSVT